MAWNKITKPVPEYVKDKIRNSLLGRTYKPDRFCLVCGKNGVRKDRKFCSQACAGVYSRGKISQFKGKHHSPESIEKMKKTKLGRIPWNKGVPNYKGRGENCHLWKGGITKKGQAIRSSLEYKNWRNSVFERDDYTCKWCSIRGGDLEAHHVKPFNKYPELIFDINNGITLCKKCHMETDSFPKNLIKRQSGLNGNIKR